MDKVPERTYEEWKEAMPDKHKIFTYAVGAILLFMFIYTFISNAAITGSAAVDASAQKTERFTGTTALLLIVFAFFGLFLFMVMRKMRMSEE